MALVLHLFVQGDHSLPSVLDSVVHLLLAAIFWWEICCLLNCLSLKGKRMPLSHRFQDFFLCVWFSGVYLWCILAWIYLGLSCLGFAQLLEYVHLFLFIYLYFPPKFETFSGISYWDTFSVLFFSSISPETRIAWNARFLL